MVMFFKDGAKIAGFSDISKFFYMFKNMENDCTFKKSLFFIIFIG